MRRGSALAVTGILIILILAASFGVINYINTMEEERSFERLYEEAGDLADNIEMYSENDREQLQILSAVIARYSDFSSPELWDLLGSYKDIGMMSRIELLLPGDIVLTEGGERVDAKGLLSFKDEASRGAHITDRENDLVDRDTHVVRHYVPVKQEGRTVAMLYGVIVLGELPEEVNLNPYSGRGALYLIDGNNGDFLIDTWHKGAAGNILQMGGREMAPGYNDEQLIQGLMDGESQYVVFVSKTVGEYLYFYYTPMAINNWRIAVSVPESVVFGSANTIARILNILLVFELICFVLYFLWMMRYVRRVTADKQKRLDTINQIYDIEQLLFNAHEKKENLHAALENVGKTISVEGVYLWILDAEGKGQWYFWEDGKTAEDCKASFDEESIAQEYAGRLLNYFKSGNGEYEAYSESEFSELFPAEAFPGVYNVMAVPVEDTGGNICGILAAFNMKKGYEQAVLLKNVKFAFGRFCSNLKSYTEIQEQGDRDVLTGLYNRNRYERDLPEVYERHKSSLACVYIDVNGLREMNNTEGHDKGDEMLRTVAGEIRKHFETEYIYRIGGDEFVLFLPDADESDIAAQSEKLASVLSEDDYHISVGIQCGENLPSLSRLIKETEQKMYAEKKKYYEKHDRRRR